MISKKQANKLRGMIARYREATIDTCGEMYIADHPLDYKTEEEQENRLHDELLAFIREITEK